MPFEALGLIETKGLIGAVEAADAIVKMANCAASTTFAGQRQLFLPAKGEQKECPSRPRDTRFRVVGWSRAVA